MINIRNLAIVLIATTACCNLLGRPKVHLAISKALDPETTVFDKQKFERAVKQSGIEAVDTIGTDYTPLARALRQWPVVCLHKSCKHDPLCTPSGDCVPTRLYKAGKPVPPCCNFILYRSIEITRLLLKLKANEQNAMNCLWNKRPFYPRDNLGSVSRLFAFLEPSSNTLELTLEDIRNNPSSNSMSGPEQQCTSHYGAGCLAPVSDYESTLSQFSSDTVGAAQSPSEQTHWF